jgi:hypothetical protein
MTAITRIPQNTNYLQATKFLLTFDRIGSTQYFCQSVNIPGVSIGQAPINTPMLDIFAPGNKITYSQLNIDFAVDEKLDSWQQIHNWFRSIASPEGFGERKRLSDAQNQYKSGSGPKAYSDATLTVLNNLNNPIVRVKFFNVFPISLSDIQFDTKMSADDIVYATATFVFDYHNFEDI